MEKVFGIYIRSTVYVCVCARFPPHVGLLDWGLGFRYERLCVRVELSQVESRPCPAPLWPGGWGLVIKLPSFVTAYEYQKWSSNQVKVNGCNFCYYQTIISVTTSTVVYPALFHLFQLSSNLPYAHKYTHTHTHSIAC